MSFIGRFSFIRVVVRKLCDWAHTILKLCFRALAPIAHSLVLWPLLNVHRVEESAGSAERAEFSQI